MKMIKYLIIIICGLFIGHFFTINFIYLKRIYKLHLKLLDQLEQIKDYFLNI